MNTIIPWISGGLGLLLALGIWQTAKFWRESKRSPYYFLRKQAEQRMQTYSMGTVATAVMLLFFVSYAWQPVEDNSLRMIELTNAKPGNLQSSQSNESTLVITQSPETIVTEESEESPDIIVLEGDSGVDVTADLIASQSNVEGERLTAEDLVPFEAVQAEDGLTSSDEVALPAEFDQFDPQVELSDDTIISEVTFSNGINEISYAPTSPAKLYEVGFYTVYATFDYDNMQDGMVWSWVWRQDGRVLSGGNEIWQYGDDGPGYIYYAPPEGFSAGEYTVEIWVNGSLQASDNMFVRDNLATSQ